MTWETQFNYVKLATWRPQVSIIRKKYYRMNDIAKFSNHITNMIKSILQAKSRLNYKV